MYFFLFIKQNYVFMAALKNPQAFFFFTLVAALPEEICLLSYPLC